MDHRDWHYEFLARSSLKDIARFRTVCKPWRSMIDSEAFRDLFISLHSSSSSICWSVIQMNPFKPSLELIGHHNCKTWGLHRSLGSLVRFPDEVAERPSVLSCTDGLVLIWLDRSRLYLVGNPLIQDWCRIFLPHELGNNSWKDLERLQRYNALCDSGLVTKLQRGVIFSYKVVLLKKSADDGKLDFIIYSSDTGDWELRTVTCLEFGILLNGHKSIALNGKLHWISGDLRSLITYDCYGRGQDESCTIVLFPDAVGDEELCFRRSITTSEGSIVYFNEFGENRNRTLRVWRLATYVDGPEAWQLSWEVSMKPILLRVSRYYSPIVMHPMNSEIIYLWSDYEEYANLV